MDPTWIVVKALVIRSAGILALGLLSLLFLRSLWLRQGDTAFSLAFTLFLLGTLWAYLAVFVGALDEMVDILPCYELRPLVLRHVELVWGPSVLASLWLLWVVMRRRTTV